MKSDRKPPLGKSPLRLRPRRVIRSPMRTPPPASTTNKRRVRNLENSSGIQAISCEMKALERMVQEELGKTCSNGLGSFGGGDVFERGRLYDVYTARRNERLRSKLLLGGEKEKEKENEEPKTAYNLGVKLGSTKKKERATTARKASASLLVDRSEHPRYALRSMKKPPIPPVPITNVAASSAKPKKRNQRK